jgi:large subunit ribosomal protein L25
MADMILIAEPRTVTGSKTKQLRRDGKTPAVVYGTGDSQLLQIDSRTLRRVLRTAGSNDLIDLDVAGSHHRVLVREVQRHVTRGDLIHVDFLEVDMTQTVSAEVTVILIGEAPVVLENIGALNQLMHSIQIECLPDKLISEMTVDVSNMDSLSSSITIADLIVPEGVTITDLPEDVVVNVYTERTEEDEEEEELEVGYEEFAEADDSAE